MSARPDENRMRVLVTGGDHTGALAAVRGLRCAGYEPWVATSSRRGYAARSRAAAGVVVLPYSGSDPVGFCDRLGDQIMRLGVGVVIPGTEQDLLAISSLPDSALRSAAGLPDHEVVLRITDKAAVYRLATEQGLDVPATTIIGRDRLLDIHRVKLPAIVKPVRSAHARDDGVLVRIDARVISTPDQLRRLIERLDDGRWLLQSQLDGRLAAVCGVAVGGRVLTTVHQVAHRVWPPGAGVSAFAETVAVDPVLEAEVARLIEALGWSGIFQAQFIRAGRGRHLIDVNPRVYGSLALATAAGANLPAVWAASLGGGEVRRVPYRVGVRYRSEELDLRALLDLARRGRPVEAWKGALPHRHTTHSVLALTDPGPGLISLEKLVRHGLRALGPQRADVS